MCPTERIQSSPVEMGMNHLQGDESKRIQLSRRGQQEDGSQQEDHPKPLENEERGPPKNVFDEEKAPLKKRPKVAHKAKPPQGGKAATKKLEP